MRETRDFKKNEEILTRHTLLQVNEFNTRQLCRAFGYFSDACATSPRTQEQLIDALELARLVIDTMFTNYDKPILTALKQGLKFITSLTAGNRRNQRYVWLDSKKHFIKWMQFDKDNDVRDLLCGIMVNIISGEKILAQEVARTGEVLERIIDAALDNSFNAKKFLNDVWLELDSEAILMGFMFQCKPSYRQHTIQSYHNFIKKHDPTLFYVEFLKNGFMKCLSEPIKNMRTHEVSELYGLLKIIVTFTSNEKYLKIFQDDLSFLELVKSLLEGIHKEGQNIDSIFSPTEDFFNDQCTIRNLKATLVRLIANLCWRNPRTQSKIREINGIPLLMDCSKRDGNNPFITEAVVFALRNICENNTENQEFVKMINRGMNK